MIWCWVCYSVFNTFQVDLLTHTLLQSHTRGLSDESIIPKAFVLQRNKDLKPHKQTFKLNAGISVHSSYPSVIQSNPEILVISHRKSKEEIQNEPLSLKGKVLTLKRVQKKLKGAKRAHLIM